MVPPCPFLLGFCVCQVASAQPSAPLGLLFKVTVSGPPIVISTVALAMGSKMLAPARSARSLPAEATESAIYS